LIFTTFFVDLGVSLEVAGSGGSFLRPLETERSFGFDGSLDLEREREQVGVLERQRVGEEVLSLPFLDDFLFFFSGEETEGTSSRFLRMLLLAAAFAPLAAEASPVPKLTPSLLRDERRVEREGVAVVSLLLPDKLYSVGIISVAEVLRRW
jgi:hypothetical protein